MIRSRAGIAGVCLVLLGAAGCSQADREPGPMTAPSSVVEEEPTRAPSRAGGQAESAATEISADAEDPCALVGTEVIFALAGAELEPQPHEVSGVPACVWGDLNSTGVQVIRVGAGLWATQLPAIVEQLLAQPQLADTLSEEDIAQLEDIVASVNAGEEIEPERGCEMFSLMMVADGQPDGTNHTVRIVPSSADPQGITAQGCIDGVYASVLLVAPDLTGSAEEVEQVGEAAMVLLDAA